MTKNIGKVAQIIGAVVDITFDNVETGLPDIYDSLEIKREDILNYCIDQSKWIILITTYIILLNIVLIMKTTIPILYV